jgi:hypothetical protein
VRGIAAAVLALLTGCSVSSNMVQIGPDRYRAEVTFGGASADGYARDIAIKKCHSLGKVLAQLSTGSGPDDGPDHATFIFECR